MKCEICDSELPNNATYCTECGLLQENRFVNQFNPVIADPFVTRIQPDYSIRTAKLSTSLFSSSANSPDNNSLESPKNRNLNDSFLSGHKLFRKFQSKRLLSMFLLTVVFLALLSLFLFILYLV